MDFEDDTLLDGEFKGFFESIEILFLTDNDKNVVHGFSIGVVGFDVCSKNFATASSSLVWGKIISA